MVSREGALDLLTQLSRNDVYIINWCFVRTLYLLHGHELVFCAHVLIFFDHVNDINNNAHQGQLMNFLDYLKLLTS